MGLLDGKIDNQMDEIFDLDRNGILEPDEWLAEQQFLLDTADEDDEEE